MNGAPRESAGIRTYDDPPVEGRLGTTFSSVAELMLLFRDDSTLTIEDLDIRLLPRAHIWRTVLALEIGDLKVKVPCTAGKGGDGLNVRQGCCDGLQTL